MQAVRAAFLTDLDGFTHAELDRTPMYTEFLRPRGLGWCAGTTIRVPGGDTLVFSVEKAFDRGPVAASAVKVLDELRPDLARAIVLSARLGLERARATVDAFQLLGLPAVVLLADGRVLAANPALHALRGTVSTGAGDALIFSDPRTHKVYQEALAAASRSPPEERASVLRGR